MPIKRGGDVCGLQQHQQWESNVRKSSAGETPHDWRYCLARGFLSALVRIRCVDKTKQLLRTAEKSTPNHTLLTQRRRKLIHHGKSTMEGLVDTKCNLQVRLQPKRVALKKHHCNGMIKLLKCVLYLLKGSKGLSWPCHPAER